MEKRELTRRDVLRSIGGFGGLALTTPFVGLLPASPPSLGETPVIESERVLAWEPVPPQDRSRLEFIRRPRKNSAIDRLTTQGTIASSALDHYVYVPTIGNPKPEQQNPIDREQFRNHSYDFLREMGITIDKANYSIEGSMDNIANRTEFFTAILGGMEDLSVLWKEMRDESAGTEEPITETPFWNKIKKLTWKYDATMAGAITVITDPDDEEKREVVITMGRPESSGPDYENIGYGLNELANALVDSSATAKQYPDMYRAFNEAVSNTLSDFSLFHSIDREQWKHPVYLELLLDLLDRSENGWYVDIPSSMHKQVFGKILDQLTPLGENIASHFNEHLGALLEYRGFWTNLSLDYAKNKKLAKSALAIVSGAKEGSNDYPYREQYPAFPDAIEWLIDNQHLPGPDTQLEEGVLYRILFADSKHPGSFVVHYMEDGEEKTMTGTRINPMTAMIIDGEFRTKPFPANTNVINNLRIVRENGETQLIAPYMIFEAPDQFERFLSLLAGNPPDGILPKDGDIFMFTTIMTHPVTQELLTLEHSCLMVPGKYNPAGAGTIVQSTEIHEHIRETLLSQYNRSNVSR